MGYDLIGVSELGEKCGSSDNLVKSQVGTYFQILHYIFKYIVLYKE